ncbi:hypothetical protein CHELA20_51188 [Hyphomicrobiales bacterium]|nr:hypothetical protein CHELA20_51188 [Hyphomicrobiales bacterium]
MRDIGQPGLLTAGRAGFSDIAQAANAGRRFNGGGGSDEGECRHCQQQQTHQTGGPDDERVALALTVPRRPAGSVAPHVHPCLDSSHARDAFIA